MQKQSENDFDLKAPKGLKSTQEWFARVITQAIDVNNRIPVLAPSGNPILEESCQFITPSPTLKPHQRIELYSQQYWWRLLTVLHDTFELTVRLFGYYEFNQVIGFPYLLKYPPNHWSLANLGNRLSQWIEEEYQADDKSLVLNAVMQDWAIHNAFTLPAKPHLMELGEDFMEKRLTLQPSVTLFVMPFDLFSVRKTFLKETPDHWEKHEFPEIPKEKTYFYIVYRSIQNNVKWTDLHEGAYFLLNLFQKSCTLDEACQALESQPEEIRSAAEEHLQTWFQDFVVRGLLAIDR